MTSIYALCHPETHEIRYVGKTNNITRRYKQHNIDNRTHTYKTNWVRSLKPLKPIMVELEVVDDNWVEAEQFWIAYFKGLGARLTNLTAGGEGTVGYTGWLGKNHSPTAKAKMSGKIPWNKGIKTKTGVIPWNKGKVGVLPDSAKIKISEAAKGNTSWLGKNHNENTKAKISGAMKGRKHTKETLNKLSELNSGSNNPGHKYGDSVVDKVKILYSNGTSKKEISKITGVSRKTILRMVS